MSISSRKNYSLQANLVLSQGIRVSISCYLKLMTYINLLTMVLKLWVPSQTYLRLLTKFDIKVKLKQNGKAGNLIKTLAKFFKDRKQRVVLNGQHSLRVNVEAGIPQDLILTG